MHLGKSEIDSPYLLGRQPIRRSEVYDFLHFGRGRVHIVADIDPRSGKRQQLGRIIGRRFTDILNVFYKAARLLIAIEDEGKPLVQKLRFGCRRQCRFAERVNGPDGERPRHHVADLTEGSSKGVYVGRCLLRAIRYFAEGVRDFDILDAFQLALDLPALGYRFTSVGSDFHADFMLCHSFASFLPALQ